MKVLYATCEVAPFSKAGGLGDVMGSLPKALANEKNLEMAIFTPLHGCIDQNIYGIKEIENSTLRILFGGKERIFKLKMTKLPGTDINVFFIDCLWYFGCFAEVYPKWLDERYEHERYVAFSMAILEYAKLLNFKADIIHSNDWHTAIIPTLLKSNYNMDEFYKNTKNVFSIHNLSYQGNTSSDILDFANMQRHIVYNQWGIEHFSRVNWMKGAINYSDRIVVVSPKYAQEIMTSEYGEGMDYTLRGAYNKVVGILNGIDYSVFNPKTDKFLVKNYDESHLENKKVCKKSILEKFGLKYEQNRPLIAMITRLVDQKGLSLIRDMQYTLQGLDADFIILGSGNKDFENLFIWLSNNTKNIRAMVGYSESMAREIYSGSDMFLMPSKFEPCGLGQLIALKYGSIPIVRATGGLDNTIVGYPLEDSYGFKFWRYNGYDMLEALNCAIEVFKNKNTTWKILVKTAMSKNFSWQDSAKQYLQLYKSLL